MGRTSRIMTSFLPGTVLRSSGAWPCTSALGLFTRRYSADKSKVSPTSKLTVRTLLSLRNRSSVGPWSAAFSFVRLALACPSLLGEKLIDQPLHHTTPGLQAIHLIGFDNAMNKS